MRQIERWPEGQTQVTEPGIYDNMPMELYLADPCPEPSLSGGCAKTILSRSALHAQREHPRYGGRRGSSSSAAEFGSAAHELLLGGSQAIEWIDAPDYKTKAARVAKQEAIAAGRTPMLEKNRARLELMVEIADEVLMSFGEGYVEQTMIWKSDGVWCRARPDWIASDRGMFVNYKTTTDADPATWVRRVMTGFQHEVSVAHEFDGARELFGKGGRDYLFLVQEVDEPFAVSVIGIGPEYEELGEQKITKARKVFRECQKSGVWPGYSKNIYWADAPSWARIDWETREGMDREPITFGGQGVF